ncbi:MAG TPA: cobamide remodeling phosphodiesterase CbiR [Desulfomonilaceae bacterium]|nr:cobamide remodeling phosphodiesterase CbiR [Desulfomonilaceae bacterium]
MRLGTTSYIYPADMLTNVRKLADKIDDIELVIFQADAEDNLPDASTIDELLRVASDHDLTYTVHLPLDLCMADSNPSVEKAVRVIRATQPLRPYAYIVHLDGGSPEKVIPAGLHLKNSLCSLETLCAESGELENVCVENLDNQPPELIDAILERITVSSCVDVGHLWKQGLDPLPPLKRWIGRARVVHMHGVGTRDHKRLSLITGEKLDPVVEFLDSQFDGVLTFEIFSERDLTDSLKAFHRSVERIKKG